ncbi:DNA-directed RNA polymerase III subunit RPC6 [Trichonephila clavata]|uniref:DNA-directed RNA polymerase III subunit RPC6 n=1 Tax=Trichonephila clavata TaxID=2740835 RepID=A0A8X6L556_TRICU|nr:DNA-directed RNA polymerase III subunit RPC6 [Trichonephila clavata]
MTDQKVSLNSDAENSLIDTLKNHPKGVTQKILMESIPSLSVPELAQILNKLIGQGKIDLLKKGKQLVYALKTDSSKKPQGADVEERLVLEAVTKAGNDGISAKELKFATNLPQPQITKMLKVMEGRRLVKSVVASNKKKLFMLFGLEPSTGVTGGTFYTGQEFETEFVDVLGEQCYKYLLQAKGLADKLSDPFSRRRASFKSSRDICDYINSLKISKVELKLSDIEKILEALIYDNKIEKSVSLTNSSTGESGSGNFYKISKSLIISAGLMRMPCGVCPVYYDCGKDKPISPSTCVYMKEWLDL